MHFLVYVSAVLAIVMLMLVAVFLDVERFDDTFDAALQRLPHPIGNALLAASWLTFVLLVLGVSTWHRRTRRQRAVQRALDIRLLHEGIEREQTQARIETVQQLLDDPHRLQIVYQPIVELASGRISGYEALSRFPGGGSPEIWFSEAAEVGMLEALEKLAVARALEGVRRLPKDVYVSVNVSPRTLLDRDFFAMFRDVEADRIVVELTEHLQIEAYEEYQYVLAKLRRLGFRLAVDDAGAGFSSLRHILQLRPNVVKADRSLLDGVPKDPVSMTLLRSLAEFVHAIPEAIIVAEGIETKAQVALLREVNINYGQGFLLDRPEPLEVLPGRYDLHLVSAGTTT